MGSKPDRFCCFLQVIPDHLWAETALIPLIVSFANKVLKGWRSEVRKELADVRQGIHAVLDALLDSELVSAREKAVLHLREPGFTKFPS